MFSNIVDEKNILYQSIPDIKEICKPILTRFGIAQFDYIRDHADVTRIHFTTSPEWAHYFYQNIDYYQASDGLVQGVIAKSGYMLWTQVSQCLQLKVYRDIQQYFNQPEGIVIIESNSHYSECYFFGFEKVNDAIPMLNNIELLYSFTSYFKDKVIKILSQADKQRIVIPKPTIKKIFDAIEFMVPLDIINQYMMELHLNNENNVSFTKRELQCINCLANDMTAKQTARELHISHRTVEHHLDNAKQKLGLHRKSSLIATIAIKKYNI